MRTTVSFVLLVLVPLTVQGATVSETLNPALFGNLSRQSSSRGSAPVSFTNSLVYLQNAFPEIYGAKGLVDYAGAVPTQSELGIVADILASPDYMDWNSGWDFCDADPNCFVDIFSSAISGHMSYIEERVPGMTRWEVWDWEAEPNFMAAIADDIRLGKVPHLFIFSVAFSTSERVFLPITGIEFDESSDAGSITYIDPRDGTAQTSGVHNALKMDYPISFGPADVGVFVSVSPIPEPEPWALACVALLGFACMARHAVTAHKPG